MFYVSDHSIQISMRQITRWMKAAKQDNHPGVMVLHINYAMGNIVMLREMVNDQRIKKVTGIDPFDLYAKIATIQDKAQNKLLKLCPGLNL